MFLLFLAGWAYPQPITVTVSPTSATLFAGQTLPMTATITNAPSGNTTTLNWAILAGGPALGSLSASTGTNVTYTAPVPIGCTQTVTVQVTSAADPSKFAQVVITLMDTDAFFPNGSAFVTRLYDGASYGSCTGFTIPNPPGGFLGRSPDPGGLSYWVGAIDGGVLTRTQVALAFFNSPEFQQHGAAIVNAYIGALGRDPDFPSYTLALTTLQGTPACLAGPPPNNTAGFCSEQALLNQLTTSSEFAAIYGGLNNTQFVTLVYQNVLGRPADANGLNFWLVQLTGGLTTAQMIQAFVNSAEFASLNYNRLLADSAYLALLGRTPDVAGRVYWTDQLSLGMSPLQLVNSFITSPEFTAQIPGNY